MGITNLDDLTLSGDLVVGDDATVGGDLVVTGTLTAGGIIGNVAVAAGVVATPDDGSTQTLTAGMVTGSTVFTAHTTTGGTTPSLTMPLATAIIAANTGWAIGDSYTLRIINLNSGTATVVTNTGITLTGTATIPTGGQADFIITMTAAATVSMVRVDAVSTVTLAAVQTLTNKTLTAPTLTTPSLGVATATSLNGLTVTTSTGTLTIPNGVVLTGPASSGTAATLAGTETLTNKTLTAPITSGLRQTPATTLTAVGNDRATSLALTADINNITSAAASTGVTLPAATVGAVVTVFNGGANAIQVYGAGSDTIDGAAAATGVPLTNAKRAQYFCVAAATWVSAQLGVVSA